MDHEHYTNKACDGMWIYTYAGRKFHFLDPRPEDICIADIAHALSNVCRFAGHVHRFYSCAQHCYVASILARGTGLEKDLLLHDASEAYLCDLPRPVKHIPGLGEEYSKIEGIAEKAIAKRFGVSAGLDKDGMKYFDNLCLALEAKTLFTPVPAWALPLLETLNVPENQYLPYEPWTPEQAEQKFLDRYYELFGL